jgi:hypothetical protein
MPITIGLFGTCGGSKWRDAFIKEYEAQGISYFNPQVPEWKPEFAVLEAEHLANDEIILFPVTKETYATGSLAETGFSIAQAINLNRSRDVVILIDQLPDSTLKEENPTAYKESARGRALVIQHLKKLKMKNVYVVSTFEQMLRVSLFLHNAATIRDQVKEFSLGE